MRILVYDIKGIQQFITSVSSLRYMVGASAIIDCFDHIEVPKIVAGDGIDKEKLACGGGKGSLECDDDAQAARLRDKLVAVAYQFGLDIAVGLGDNSDDAFDRVVLFPFVPDPHGDYACGASGMYPVDQKAGLATGVPMVLGQVHDVVFQRYCFSSPFRKRSGDHCIEPGSGMIDKLGCRVLENMRKCTSAWPTDLGKCQFMRNVRPSSEEDPSISECDSGDVGAEAIGGRNRWAVLCMDGNDMGHLHRYIRDQVDSIDPKLAHAYTRDLSRALDRLTHGAVARALAETVAEWWRDLSPEERISITISNQNGDDVKTLPFRPLVVGGDDVWIISHCDYAVYLAKRIAHHYETGSFGIAKDNPDLLKATNGKLTISAGLVFIKNSYPIATAIAYAEKLLKSAKQPFRQKAEMKAVDGQSCIRVESADPNPAALDFEVITEGLLDAPQDRRGRELAFSDPDTGDQLLLTGRPYLLCDGKPSREHGPLSELEKVVELLRKEEYNTPGGGRHVLAEVLRALQLPALQRQATAWRLRKNHPLLADLLEGESRTKNNDEWARAVKWAWPEAHSPGHRICRLGDAILLLEEENRLSQNSIDEELE